MGDVMDYDYNEAHDNHRAETVELPKYEWVVPARWWLLPSLIIGTYLWYLIIKFIISLF